MGTICGWLGESSEDQAAVLKEMVAAATGCAASEVSSHVDSRAAVASCDAHNPFSVYRSPRLCAAIEGHPKWTDTALAQVAEAKGFAHALADGYGRHGVDVLKRLSGDFALCILKPEEGYALLAIDRVGIRPLAYTSADGQLVFGSQITSLLAHPAVSAKLAPQGIFDYLYFHMIPSPGTIFQDIFKLQPGEYLERDGSRLRRGFYWQLAYTEESAGERQLAAELRSQLDDSVSACLSDRPTGAFLSGGLDSSTVCGVFQGLSKEKIDAYGIGFDAEGYDEMAYARATAEHFDITLHEYYVTPQDVLDAIPLITAAYDEPFGNASAIPAYFCAKFAKEAGKEQLLAGDGGDEIFAGNARYARQKIFDLYRHVPSLLKRALIEPAAYKLPPLRKLKSYIEQSRVPMPERMETYNFLHRTPLEQIFTREFLAQIDPHEPSRAMKAHYDRAAGSPIVKQMLFFDHKYTLADNDLRKVSRMCELAGVDVRYPLLTDSMMEFAARVPAGMLLKRLELRSFYRSALKEFLAKETLEKSKHGFGLPFGLWISEYPPLKAFAHENLQRFRQRGILDDAYISSMIQAQETGHAAYYGVFIWIIVMLEQWLESKGIAAGS